jgi:hypothetical protein
MRLLARPNSAWRARQESLKTLELVIVHPVTHNKGDIQVANGMFDSALINI